MHFRTERFTGNIDNSSFREAGAVILKIAYGYTIEPHKRDPLVHIANLALEHFSIAGTPGAWLVDMIPLCESHNVRLSESTINPGEQ